MYVHTTRARVCCCCSCVYLTVSCQHKAHTERRLFFPNNIHIKRREGKKCKNFSKTEMNSFTCLFVWLLRRAFPSAFFSLFCLHAFFSLSLSRLLFCNFSTSSQKNTHPQKSHQTQFSLFLSLFRRRRRRRRRRTRWSSVRVVSDLRFFPLVLVVGRA